METLPRLCFCVGLICISGASVKLASSELLIILSLTRALSLSLSLHLCVCAHTLCTVACTYYVMQPGLDGSGVCPRKHSRGLAIECQLTAIGTGVQLVVVGGVSKWTVVVKDHAHLSHTLVDSRLRQV